MNLLALLIAVLGMHGGQARPASEQPEGPPGSETYGKRFCELQEIPMASRRRIRLHVERPAVRKGESAFARVENRGDLLVEFGVFYEVQRRVETRWRRVPDAGVIVGPDIALLLDGGQSGYCMRYRVPKSAPSGRYRFVREISDRITGDELPYAAEFRVR